MNDTNLNGFSEQKRKNSRLEDMNKELREWIEEHGVIPEERKEQEDKIEGTCHVCEIRDAKHRCIRCGNIACLACFWIMLGICKECITEEKMKELKEHHF